MTYLLDTNICIALLCGHANAVAQLDMSQKLV